MARGYGQYCPLALAAELLTQRWTLLVVSRVLDGCHTFNAIHRGVPRMSPSLLSQRLRELQDAGLVVRHEPSGKQGARYDVTPAGRDLNAVIEQMAVWGQHWARDMTTEDLDPGFLAWSMHTRLDTRAMPPGRTVLEFVFEGAPTDCRRFWLVHEDGEVDMCLKHPGHASDLVVRADLRRFIETWRGFRDLRRELREGRIRLEGARDLKQRLPRILMLSSLAPYARKRTGREQDLADRPPARPRSSGR